MPKLVVSGTAHELVEELITIGRSPDNTIVIGDPSVSSRHAQLQLVGETYRLKDLGSTNGTRVNGIPTTDAALRFDDRIRFGAVEARYEPDAMDRSRYRSSGRLKPKPAELRGAPVDFATHAIPASESSRGPNSYRHFCQSAVALDISRGA
jgi:pSer/pThr/pTyr-binding forkhead associated (FHA) protein